MSSCDLWIFEVIVVLYIGVFNTILYGIVIIEILKVYKSYLYS